MNETKKNNQTTNNNQNSTKPAKKKQAETMLTPPTENTPNTQYAEIAQLSYENARAQLIETVKQLENSQAPLEDTMKLWERGEALASRCQQILDTAQEKLAQRQA